MTFQERKGTCGMEPERFGRNLAEKSGTDRDLKWDEICSVLFHFLNWYGMFRPFRAERNGIDNLAHTTHTHTHTHTWSTNWISIVLQRVFRSLDYIYYIASFSETKEKWEFYGTVVDCFYFQSLSENNINHILKLYLIV
jgi:hypothetical protein